MTHDDALARAHEALGCNLVDLGSNGWLCITHYQSDYDGSVCAAAAAAADLMLTARVEAVHEYATDLVERLSRAAEGLKVLSETAYGPCDSARLDDKAGGVRLAQSYVEEALR